MTAAEFIRTLPQKFNPEAVAPDAETCFHFLISGEGGGDFTATVKDCQCKVQDGLNGDAKCVVQCTAQTFEDIVSRKQNPQMALTMGKLKISNLGEMMKYTKQFAMM